MFTSLIHFVQHRNTKANSQLKTENTRNWLSNSLSVYFESKLIRAPRYVDKTKKKKKRGNACISRRKKDNEKT